MQEGSPNGPAGAVQQQAAPSCVSEDGSLCQWIYEVTGIDWLARSADTLLDTALSLLTIVAIATVLRMLVHRAISRATDRISSGTTPSWLAALRTGMRDQPERAVKQPPRYRSAERRAQRARTIGSLLRSVSTFVIYGVALMMVLSEFGINVAPILASAGVLGIAIGFGAQNLIRDFLSGIFMMLEDQYGVGDTVDLGEVIGDVEAVGLRTTTIRDISGTVWYVRNGEILRVGNFSQGYAVAVVDVPLAHHADVAMAGELVEQAAREVTEGQCAEDVLEEPQLLGVQEVTTYGLILRLTVKTRPGRQWAVRRALNARVQSALTEASIPAPAVVGVPLRDQ